MSRTQNIIIVLLIIALNFSIIFLSGLEEYNIFLVNAALLLIIMIVEARLLFQFTSKDTNYGEKHKENRFNMFLVILGFAPIVTSFVIVMEYFEQLQMPIFIIGGVLIFLVIYLTIAYFTVSITRDHNGISCNYYWIRNKEIKYNEVEKVYINKVVNAIVLQDESGTKVYIDMMLIDLHVILNDIYNNVDKEKTEKLFKELKTFYKALLLKPNLEELDAYKDENSN